ncbi:MAG TPA: GNAT family N-acetyltransferase [Gemmatimonadales bacterium]|nr:GNAT family N-acetyltransferase [Gemmatimonadales bacterium]
MDVHNLGRIFNPTRIALVGVTQNPNSVGGKVLGNLVGGGFRGVVYPVSAGQEAVLGVPCYPDVAALPKTPDLAIVCSPAAEVPAQVDACGEAGIRGLIVVSAGFKETGAAGKRLEDEIRAAQARYDGMRIVGPNCLGIIVPHLGLNASFAPASPRAGDIAFISQSGALCASVLDWALESRIGFSHFVSIGNSLDVDFGELIDYCGEDEHTRSIILYIESVTDARSFMTAARAFARQKPIIAFKAGRFPASAHAAASHTGAMASEDAVYDAAFQRTGIARVPDLGDVFDCAALIGRGRVPAGPRLGIVTNAGGPGVIATDALIAQQGELAALAPGTLARLDEDLPPAWSHGNPVDVLGDANSRRIEKAVAAVLADGGVDAVLAIVTPQAMTNPTATARSLARLAAESRKPLLAAWLGGRAMRDGLPVLAEANVAAYPTPEQAVRAFMTLVGYARNLETLYETPKDVVIQFPYDRAEAKRRFVAERLGPGGVLPEDVSKELLASYGIRVVQPEAAASAQEAIRAAQRIGYPVVLKVRSPDISHKTEVGGVKLDLGSPAMVQAGFDAIMRGARERRPDARLEGVTVQPMIRDRDGHELILGIKKDPVFGTVILAGMGGVGAELIGDRSLGFPPLNERLAMRMLESLRMWPLLAGYRGSKPVKVESLVQVLIRLSYLAADWPEIVELDVNPLLCTPYEVIALDARAVVDRALVGAEAEPYAHLALRPYPEKFVNRITLKEGVTVTLRPIKPEDEPLWLAMLGSCSKETIYSRFRYLFDWSTHEVATRYCYIDYAREIAIVAEIGEGSARRLIGVGRLIADPSHRDGEYAVLVVDEWQHRELGGLLTDYCLEIARGWKLERVVAQTTTDNRPMIAVFERRGFEVVVGEDSAVEVSKRL